MLIAPKRLKQCGLQILHPCFQGHPGQDPLIFFENGVWPGSRDSLNFWALNANSSKTVKATDFKLNMHVSTDSLDMIFFEKGASVKIHLAEIMHSHGRLLVLYYVMLHYIIAYYTAIYITFILYYYIILYCIYLCDMVAN